MSNEKSRKVLRHQGWRRRLSKLLNALLSRLGYALIRTHHDQQLQFSEFQGTRYGYQNLQLLDVYAPWFLDESFTRVWEVASKNTLADILRGYELFQCVHEVKNIPGDILEVGVWRGGTGAILAAAASIWKPLARVWLCDTFSGVVKAGDHDAHYRGGEHHDTSENIVTDLLAALNLQNASTVRGIFPDESASALAGSKIALCHVDVDVYRSAADIVDWLRPRLSSGSMLIFDDYGFSSCKGITRYVNELRLEGDWIYLYNLNKHAVLIKR